MPFIAGGYAVVFVDARRDRAGAQALCARLVASRNTRVVTVVREESLVVLTAEWAVDDFVVPEIGPAELDARLRLLRDPAPEPWERGAVVHSLGELVIDESTQSARLGGRVLGLSSQEFGLLKVLTQWPDRVFTRCELLRQVWGAGGQSFRTVDVHIRSLRSKADTDRHDTVHQFFSLLKVFIGDCQC